MAGSLRCWEPNGGRPQNQAQSLARHYASDGFLFSRAVGGFIADTLLHDKRGLITNANGGGLSATIGYNGVMRAE